MATQRVQVPWMARQAVRGIDLGLSRLVSWSRYAPGRWLRRYGVVLKRNVSYVGAAPAHRLDIYRPLHGRAPHPVVLYVHGGGFSMLSKDTHWMMALAFARRGFVVFNINYRLAPQHPFPAALEDCGAALAWVLRHAHAYGGDVRRLVFAGESAGANLVTALTVCACYTRPEPFARSVFAHHVVPAAVVPACGMLQVSDPERFHRRKAHLSPWVDARIRQVSNYYLAGRSPRAEAMALCDPLTFLERGAPPQRPLPPFFIPVGTRDPLLDDSRRLQAALTTLGAVAQANYYVGGLHAFHALLWQPLARRCWDDTMDFLANQIEGVLPGTLSAAG